jgi:hypothetical protein
MINFLKKRHKKTPKSTDQTFNSGHESGITLKNTNKINYENKFSINPILKDEIKKNQLIKEKKLSQPA